MCDNSSTWVFYLNEVLEFPNNFFLTRVFSWWETWRCEVEEVLVAAVAHANDAGLSEKLRGHVVVVVAKGERLDRKRETIFRLARTSLSHML